MTGSKKTIIAGAGFTGLGAGFASGFQVLEAGTVPGGICASYEREGFKFEIGGGHWIFGGDPHVVSLIEHLTPCKRYERRSAVFFAGNLDATRPLRGKFVTYPIQNHLSELGNESSSNALKDLLRRSKENRPSLTMDEWLLNNFGDTLHEMFFGPFHEKYTAGLYRIIAPQDPYKSPFSIKEVINGASGNAKKDVGYNVSYLYPHEGLNTLAAKLSRQCRVDYETRIARVIPESRLLILDDGRQMEYGELVSTVPLNRMLEMCGTGVPDQPFTSVLVLNMGVELGLQEISRHGNHWLYVPDSKSGFHRVGYYSNVDERFLPQTHKDPQRFASLYIEFAFRNGQKPPSDQIEALIRTTIDELREWGFIKQCHIVDPTWIDVAYTWTLPGSRFIDDGIKTLAGAGIVSVGRYGRWNFQGILESLKEGLVVGTTRRAVNPP